MSTDLTRGLVLTMLALGGIALTVALVLWCVSQIAASLAALELADYRRGDHVAASPLPRETGEGRGGGANSGEPPIRGQA